MTIAQHIIERIEDEARARLEQAARESFRDDTALAFWEELLREGKYRQAARHWWMVVEPTTRER